MSYSKLAQAFKDKTPYKYDKHVHFDGTKIVAVEFKWEYTNGRWQRKSQEDKIVLAEHIEHNGKSYAVVYNRGNKCFATEVLAYGYHGRSANLQYGEIGIPHKDQQRAYRCQMIDSLIYSGAISHILIPTSFEGDSDFFKLLEG